MQLMQYVRASPLLLQAAPVMHSCRHHSRYTRPQRRQRKSWIGGSHPTFWNGKVYDLSKSRSHDGGRYVPDWQESRTLQPTKLNRRTMVPRKSGNEHHLRGATGRGNFGHSDIHQKATWYSDPPEDTEHVFPDPPEDTEHVFPHLHQQDPPEDIEHVFPHLHQQDPPEDIEHVFPHLHQQDPPEDIEHVFPHLHQQDPPEDIEHVFPHLHQQDPPEDIEHVFPHLHQQDPPEDIEHVFPHLHQQDPPEGIEHVFPHLHQQDKWISCWTSIGSQIKVTIFGAFELPQIELAQRTFRDGR